MERLFNIFYLNQTNVISGWFVIFCGLIGACLTIVIGLPQVIHLIKTKNSGLVKYYSFWFFFAGILGWISIGAFDPNQKILIIVIANILCGLIYVFVLWLVYKYSNDPKRKAAHWYVLGIASSLMITITTLAICGLVFDLKTPENLQAVLGQIFPILTTFAFLPQALKSIDAKDYSGMSLGMVVVFLVANVFWCSYWLAFIFNAGVTPQYLSAIVWQVISLLFYLLVFILMMIDKKQKKKLIQTTINNEKIIQSNGD